MQPIQSAPKSNGKYIVAGSVAMVAGVVVCVAAIAFVSLGLLFLAFALVAAGTAALIAARKVQPLVPDPKIPRPKAAPETRNRVEKQHPRPAPSAPSSLNDMHQFYKEQHQKVVTAGLCKVGVEVVIEKPQGAERNAQVAFQVDLLLDQKAFDKIEPFMILIDDEEFYFNLSKKVLTSIVQEKDAKALIKPIFKGMLLAADQAATWQNSESVKVLDAEKIASYILDHYDAFYDDCIQGKIQEACDRLRQDLKTL